MLQWVFVLNFVIVHSAEEVDVEIGITNGIGVF